MNLLELASLMGQFHTYLALAVAKVYDAPTDTINLESMAQSIQEKSGPNCKTIIHLCGHKWCMSGDHYTISTEVFNLVREGFTLPSMQMNTTQYKFISADTTQHFGL